MTFQQAIRAVMAWARALWAALPRDRIAHMMSQIDPTRISEPHRNGDGPVAKLPAVEASQHGGPADGLPVAARRLAPRELAGDAVAAEPQADDEAAGEEVGLTGVLESLLFVAGEPVDVASIAKTLDLPAATVEQGLADLAEEYKRQERGLRLQVHNGKYQLVTAPAAAPYVEEFLNLDFSTKLSSAALETLAVVAYRQPVTRAQIEAVRGVDCAAVLRSLMQRGLIEETGRLEAAGRPILYGVTDLFMQHFGLMELGELPPLAHEDEDLLHAATALAAADAGAVPPGTEENGAGRRTEHTEEPAAGDQQPR